MTSIRRDPSGSVSVSLSGVGQMDDQVAAYAKADAYGKDAIAAATLSKGWVGENYDAAFPVAGYQIRGIVYRSKTGSTLIRVRCSSTT